MSDAQPAFLRKKLDEHGRRILSDSKRAVAERDKRALRAVLRARAKAETARRLAVLAGDVPRELDRPAEIAGHVRVERSRTGGEGAPDAGDQPATSGGRGRGRPPLIDPDVPPWLTALARSLADELPLLDPKFSSLLAKAVLKQAAKMPEREVVSALNVCTTMAAKAKLMQGKGLTKDIDPLSEIRDWFKQSTLVEPAGEADTGQSEEAVLPEDLLTEVDDGEGLFQEQAHDGREREPRPEDADVSDRDAPVEAGGL